MRKKMPAALNIGVDIDTQTINDFKCDYPVELVNGCAHEFIGNYSFNGQELVYADPPYLHSTRTSNTRYRYEYSKHDHIEMLELLGSLPCNVMVSGYPSTLYDELLPNWRCLEMQCMSHGGVRTEVIWFNFKPNAAYWCSYAGKDFTDRQRIKRKAARWAKNYAEMPASEKLAVMAAMLETEISR